MKTDPKTELNAICQLLASHGYPDDEPVETLRRVLPQARTAIKSCLARNEMESFSNTFVIGGPDQVAKYATLKQADFDAQMAFWDAWA